MKSNHTLTCDSFTTEMEMLVDMKIVSKTYQLEIRNNFKEELLKRASEHRKGPIERKDVLRLLAHERVRQGHKAGLIDARIHALGGDSPHLGRAL